LKYQRGVSFEEMIRHRVIAIVDHPQRPDQRKILFEYEGYVWVAPCVFHEDGVFLKTLYPCRKYTKLYRGEIEDEED
jgi:hypothetical protein